MTHEIDHVMDVSNCTVMPIRCFHSRLQRSDEIPSSHRSLCRIGAHLFNVTLASETSIDNHDHMQETQADNSQVHRFFRFEIHTGKGVVPLRWSRQSEKSTSKARQMRGQTLRLPMIGQWTNLENPSDQFFMCTANETTASHLPRVHLIANADPDRDSNNPK